MLASTDVAGPASGAYPYELRLLAQFCPWMRRRLDTDEPVSIGLFVIQSRRRQGTLAAAPIVAAAPAGPKYFPLAKIPTDLSSRKVRHDIRDEKFTGLYVVPPIAVY